MLQSEIDHGCAVPGFPSEAVVSVTRLDWPDTINLRVGDSIVWTLSLGANERVVRVGTLPDLDLDNVAEIRIGIVEGAGSGVKSLVLSGQTGRILQSIDPRHTDTMWPDAKSAFQSLWPDNLPLISPLRNISGDSAVMHRLKSLLASPRAGQSPPRVAFTTSAHDRNSAPIDPRFPLGPLAGQDMKVLEVLFEPYDTISITRDIAPHATYPRRWFDKNLDGAADDWDLDPPQDWDEGDIRAPLALVCGETVRASQVTFALDTAYQLGQTLPSGAQAIGKVSGTDTYFSNNITYHTNGTRVQAWLTGQSATETTIAFWEDWEIEWRIQAPAATPLDPPQVWTANATRNHVYFVLEEPMSGFDMYYSIIDIGCRNGDGKDGTNPIELADAIWAEFADCSVRRSTDVLEGRSDPALTYYADWLTPHDSVDTLLANGHGQCTSWSDFYINCLMAVGVTLPDPYVYITTALNNPNNASAVAVFLVKEWQFQGNGINPIEAWEDTYPYLNIEAIPDWHDSDSYLWVFHEVDDANGTQGQGPTGNPLSYFVFHEIVCVEHETPEGAALRYYDPSYGCDAHDSFEAWENASISAVGLSFRIQGILIPEDEINFNLNPETGDTDQLDDVNCHAVFIRNTTGETQMQESRSDGS